MSVNLTHHLHHKGCEPQVFYVDANAAVLLHFIAVMETHLLASYIKWNLLLETFCIYL